MTKSVANVVISRMRLDGVTVKAWAESNGHKPDPVYKTLYGTRGKANRGVSLKIKEGLRQAGYWPEDAERVEAANG
jgi:gp16 family phage-associated protein